MVEFGLDNLFFLGLKPKSELPKWVQASSATLFATTNNPVQDTSSPNKVFDSFAAGVPIIQTSKGWIADLVEKEDCGVNIPLEDPAEGARLLYEFSKKREILEEKGKNAYRLAETIFNRDILAKKYLDIICEVLTKKKTLKLIYFYQYFGTPKGSWSTRVYELSKRWVEADVDVTVVSSPYYKSDIKAKGFLSIQKVEGINLVVIDAADSNKDPVIKRMINSIIFALMSVYYALTRNYDVIVCSSGPLTIGLPGVLAKIIRRKKLVFEVRDLWPQGSVELNQINSQLLIKLAFWFEKLCYRKSDLIVPCSIDMEKSILSRFKDMNTCVIPNASDSSFYNTPHVAPMEFPEFLRDKNIFLYAGSLGLMDDCMQIIEAVKLIPDSNIAIVFAGDGAEKTIIEAEVDGLVISVNGEMKVEKVDFETDVLIPGLSESAKSALEKAATLKLKSIARLKPW